MKKIGFFVLVIGVVGLIASLGMDTTVASSHSNNRIHNIGLMNEKQNFLLVSVAIAIAGVVTLVFGYRSEPSGQAANKVAANAGQATRTCPFCAEQIMAQAVVCRYCGRDISPLDTSASKSAPFVELSETSTERDNVSRYLRQVETRVKTISSKIAGSSAVSPVLKFAFRFEEHLGKIGFVLLASGITVFLYYVISYSTVEQDMTWLTYRLRDAASIFFAGLFLLLRNNIARPFASGQIVSDAVAPKLATTSKSTWMFFGEAVDLVVIQAAMVLSVAVLHRGVMLNTAYVFALLVMVAGYVLTRCGNRVFGFVTLLFGASYLGYRHFVYGLSNFFADSLGRTLEVPFIVSVEPYVWLLIVSVALPHLRFIRLGNLRYGKLRGDSSRTIAGHEIFLPLMSALVFSVLWFGIWNAGRYGYFFMTVRS